MIDRYLLRYVLAVIDHGNFTRAAEACNVTQSTLSIGIGKLESMLGQRLFRRTSRRVDLTPEGVRFAAHAREIEAAFQRAEQSMDAGSPQRVLRLGVLSTLPADLVARLAVRLGQDSGAQVELIEGRARDLRERLQTGRIDLALTLDQGGGISSVPVHEESYAMALPPTHPLASAGQIEAVDLADNVMLVRRHCEVLAQTSQFFTARGVRPFFAARTTRDDQALAYVASGLGVTLMPACFRHPGVVMVPLAGFDLTRTIAVEAMRESADQALCATLARKGFADIMGW